MIIKDIYIDNYGCFSNVSCVGLTAGLNVVCGPNEYGKTTLLEFVRRILFGFPNRKYPGNLYLPLDGALPGGRLMCELDDGSAITIERRGLAKGGTLDISLANGQRLDAPADLTRLLQATESFYRNVYAVTIEELYSIDSLRHEEIKSRIYGAGLDLGGVSLAAVKKEFHDSAEQIFKPRGQNQRIALIKNELRELAARIKAANEILPLYEKSLEESSALHGEIAALRERSEIRLLEIKRLKRWSQAYDDLLRYNEIEIVLHDIPEVPEIGDDDVESWQKLETATITTRSALERFADQRGRHQRELDALKLNQALLALRDEVVTLERSAERFRSDLAALQQLSRKRDETTQLIDSAREQLVNLGADENAAVAVFNLAEIKRAECFKHRFEELRRFHDMFKSLVGSDKNLSSRHPAAEWKTIVPPVAIALTVIVLGLLLSIDGFLLAGGVMAGACVLFVLVRYLVVRGANGSTVIADIREKADCCTALDAEWNAFLSEHGLSTSLTPDAFLAAAEKHQELTRMLRERARLDAEIAEKQVWLDSIRDNFARAAVHVSGQGFNGEMAADIAIISEAFRSAEVALRERDKLTVAMEQLDAEIAVGKSQLGELQEEQRRMLDKFGVADGGELKHGRRYSQQRAELTGKLTDLKIRIKTAFGGLDAEIKGIRCLLKDFSREDAEIKVAGLEQEEVEFQTLLAGKNRRLGELDNQRKHLVSDDELVLLRNCYEQKLQELRNAADQWAVCAVAGVLIERAVGKYEQERQPEVINHASSLFAEITAQRYRGIRKLVDSDDLTAIAANGRICNIMELSRGTREQLYLAMRLGLIKQYEARSEKLPVILDDILVNFDETRLRAAIGAISKFAVDRQVIVLTCHPRLRDILLDAGANQATPW